MRSRVTFFLLNAVALAVSCKAGLVFTLTPPTLSALPGSAIEFTAALTNTGNAAVFLNGDVSALLFSDLTVDDSPFFANAPLSLASQESYVGPIFDVIVDSVSISGEYSGTFTVQGGADANAFDDLATQDFQVTVAQTATPEPASLSLACGGVIILMLLSARIRRQAG